MTINTRNNKGFASDRLTGKSGVLCFYLSSVLIDSFGSKTNPNSKPENVMPYKKIKIDNHICYEKKC